MGGRRGGGGSSSSSDSEPWANQQIHVRPTSQKPLVWELGQRGGSKANRILKSPSQGDNIEGSEKSYFPKTVQPHPCPSTHHLLRASGNACDGASCPFCRASGLLCGGAGIQSGRGRGKEGARVSLRTIQATEDLPLLNVQGKEPEKAGRSLELPSVQGTRSSASPPVPAGTPGRAGSAPTPGLSAQRLSRTQSAHGP